MGSLFSVKKSLGLHGTLDSEKYGINGNISLEMYTIVSIDLRIGIWEFGDIVSRGALLLSVLQ